MLHLRFFTIDRSTSMKIIMLLFVLLTCNIYAQNNYISGTIVTNNDKTLKGEINYQDWLITPEVIKFKSGESIKKFDVSEIKSFEVEGDKFISKKVKLDVTEQKLGRMKKGDKPLFVDKIVFLNVLVEGAINLYEFYDSRLHFFVEKEGDFIELINRKYIGEDNNDLITYKKYLGQLSFLLNECTSVKVKGNLSYERKEFSKLINEYNLCVSPNKQEEDLYVKSVDKKRNHFYATGGLLFTNFSIDSENILLKYFDGGSISSVGFGGAYEITLSKNLERLTLYNELVYSSYSESFNNATQATVHILYDPLKIEYSSIGFFSIFRYKFIKGNSKVNPFFNVGVGYNFVVSHNASVTRTNTFNSTEQVLPIDLFNKKYLSLPMGIGVIYDKFSLELRYILSNQVLNVFTNENKVSSIGLMLGYKLN